MAERDAIVQTMCAFFRALDESDYAACGALFAADGRWNRQGRLVEGVDDLIRTLGERPADLRTRHVLTNFIVDEPIAGRATLSCYLSVYAQHGARDAVLPLTLPSAIAGYRADLVAADDGAWRIVMLDSTVYYRN